MPWEVKTIPVGVSPGRVRTSESSRFGSVLAEMKGQREGKTVRYANATNPPLRCGHTLARWGTATVPDNQTADTAFSHRLRGRLGKRARRNGDLGEPLTST